MEPAPDLCRCPWAGSDPLYLRYHDEEWGVPKTRDIELFEKMILEGFQSGLSWITILRKREAFREAFDGFDAAKMAEYGDAKIAELLGNAGIVRHRGKIEATIANARATLEVQGRYGSLAALVWSHEPARRGRGVPAELGQVPPKTPESVALSKSLLGLGFKFVGPTTVYAAMQSLGVVNDHLQGCWVRGVCTRDRRAATIPSVTKKPA